MSELIKVQDIENNDLTKLTFSFDENAEQLEWTEKGKEFSYNNEMYDVVRIVVEKDSITYFCINDKNEKSLMDDFVSLIKKNQGSEKKNRNDYSKGLSKYNYTSKGTLTLVRCLNVLPSFTTILYESLHKQVNSPPPEIV